MRGLALISFAALLGGCNSDCVRSADIQVMVVPGPGVDVSKVMWLRVTLVVGDGTPKTVDFTPQRTIASSGSAFLLHPDPPPAASYNLTVTVDAMDPSGAIVAVGSDAQHVTSNGCNRLTTHLASLPFIDTPPPSSDMMSTSDDMAGPGCIGGLPDEDSDNRANSCDLCSADPEPNGPADADSDGVPDACDPDPNTAGNMIQYFDLFDVDNHHWAEGGNAGVTSSFFAMVTGANARLISPNNSDTLPVNARAQTVMFVPRRFDTAQFSDGGLYLFTNSMNIANPNDANSNGILCMAQIDPVATNPDTLQLLPITGGVTQRAAGTTTGAPLPTGLPENKFLRLRLTQRGGKYECELAQLDQTTNTLQPLAQVTLTGAPTPSGNQYMALRATNLEAHFHSVFAETALP
jgi:hypothetical protein